MALSTTVTALATTTLLSMYLNAKHLIWHDLTSGALAHVSKAAVKFAEQRYKEDRMSIYHDLESHAKNPENANNVFLMCEGRTWTFRHFWEDVTRVGLWLVNDLKVQRGEVVALDGNNSPEYIMVWLALEAIGAVPAFVNCNLTKGPLVHCVKICGAKFLLCDSEIRGLVAGSSDEIQRGGCKIVWYDGEIIENLKPFEGVSVPQERRTGMKPDELGSLIYTSGTTGLPKGTIMLRGRELNTARGVCLYLGLRPGVKMYTCLPLYHGAAHGLCVTPAIFAGSTVVLSRKFSHKKFWPEVFDSKADIVQYVGELCRYLINAPPSSLDKKHNVQMAWGNGMRPDVWDIFRERFNIPAVVELYAATDGLGASFNNNKGEFGRHAIGKRGLIWKYLNNSREKRVRMDVVTQEILRDENGFAIECKDGEPGEVVHLLDPNMEKLMWAGYVNNEDASEKRKIRNLFKKGDLWFRSGDMMRQDSDGCVYFVDRLGDTFRWKSENVSTNEVGDVLGRFDQIAEANVYGVLAPHSDGRCGCAAVVMADGVTEQDLDFAALAQHCIGTLPRYAVPIFIRIVKELQYTGTMKVQKGKLRDEGIDLDRIFSDSACQDSMYWLPPSQTQYVPFGRKEWTELKGGKVRL